MPMDNLEQQRASRFLVMQDTVARRAYEEEQAAKQQSVMPSGDKGGQPIKDSAPAVDPRQVAYDRVTEAEKSVAAEEKEMAKSFVKGIGPNTAGMAVDLISTVYNTLQQYTRPIPMLLGLSVPPSMAPEAKFGGKWMRDRIIGEHPTNAQAAGYDLSGWGVDPTQFFTGGALKLAYSAAGSKSASLLPMVMLHNGKEMQRLRAKAQPFIDKLLSMAPRTPEWFKLNKELYHATGGVMMDTSNVARLHVATDHVTVNPKFLDGQGRLTNIPAGAVLGDVLSTSDFLTPLHPQYKEMLLKLPIEDLTRATDKNTMGALDYQTGIVLGGGLDGAPADEVISTVLHEVEHQMQYNAGSALGASYSRIADELGVPELRTEAGTLLKQARIEMESKYYTIHGKHPPETFKETLSAAVNEFSRRMAAGEPLPETLVQNLEKFRELNPHLDEMLLKSAEFHYAAKIAFRQYESVAGEVMARVVQNSRKAGVFPLDNLGDTSLGDIVLADKRTPAHHVANINPATGKAVARRMPATLIAWQDLQERILYRAEQLGALDVDALAGTGPDEIARIADKVAESMGPEELTELVAQQRADMLASGSKWNNEYANKTLEETLAGMGADMRKAREVRYNPNAAFPSHGTDTSLDPTWGKRKKELGITREQMEQANAAAAGGPAALAKSRRDMAEKVSGHAKVVGVSGRGQTTLKDRAMRVPDSQGVKGPQSGGLPPKEPGSTGGLLEEVGKYATGGDSKVWIGGKYNPEAAITRATNVMGERLKGVTKTFSNTAKARREATPTFWAYDPETDRLLAVGTDKEGKLAIVDRKKKPGKMPDDWKDYIDAEMTEADLRTAISKVVWDRVLAK